MVASLSWYFGCSVYKEATAGNNYVKGCNKHVKTLTPALRHGHIMETVALNAYVVHMNNIGNMSVLVYFTYLAIPWGHT